MGISSPLTLLMYGSSGFVPNSVDTAGSKIPMTETTDLFLETLEHQRADQPRAQCLSAALLEALAEGTLGPTETEEAVSHLGQCLSCINAYAMIRSLLDSLDPAEQSTTEQAVTSGWERAASRGIPSAVIRRAARRLRSLLSYPMPGGWAPRYDVPSLATAGLVVFGIYYAASTVGSAKPESQERSVREAADQQRAALDQLRTTVVAARDRASKADATALAVEVMSRGQAAQAEGERLSTAGDVKAATQAYQEATNRYGEAERLAQVKREQRTAADAARAQMVAAKQRASTDAPDFARAVETEKEGGTMYTRTSFTEATASFRAATELFAKAAPPAERPTAAVAVSQPAAPTPSNPRAEVRATLDNYVLAVETKDIELLRQVRPGLTDEEINRTRASNEIKRSQKIDLKVDEITIKGDEAQVLGRREDVIILRDGQRLRQGLKFVYTLKRGPRGWVIQEIRENADKSPRE